MGPTSATRARAALAGRERIAAPSRASYLEVTLRRGIERHIVAALPGGGPMIAEALTLYSLLLPTGPDAFKCPPDYTLRGHQPRTPVVVVDGEITREDGATAVEGDSVHTIEVVCWNPETDELPSEIGIQLILITTKERAGAVRAELESVIEALQAFARSHSRLPTNLDGLGSSEGVARAFRYSVSEGRWSLESRGPAAYVCSGSGSGAELVETECQPSHDLVKQNLRARWDRLPAF